MVDWQNMVESGEAEMVGGVLYKNRVEVGRMVDGAFIERDGAVDEAAAAPVVVADSTATLNTPAARAADPVAPASTPDPEPVAEAPPAPAPDPAPEAPPASDPAPATAPEQPSASSILED